MGNDGIHNLLVVPKDKGTITLRSWIIYKFKCNQAGCKGEYTGESGRTFETCLRKILGLPLPYMNIVLLQDTASMWRFFSIVVWEAHSITRTIKEAMTHPTMGSWASFSCPLSGMRSCRTPLPSI